LNYSLWDYFTPLLIVVSNIARLFLLECEVIEDRRIAVRMEEMRMFEAMEDISDLQNQSKKEAADREGGDIILLNNMVDIQEELQRITLDNFGKVEVRK